jgi:hypothetical protein
MVQTRLSIASAILAIVVCCGGSAASARFLQVDPVGYQDQVNLYAYVENDPLNRTDRSGLAGSSDHYEDVIAGRVQPAVTPEQALAAGELAANLLEGFSELLNSQPEMGGPESGSIAAGLARAMRTEARAAAGAAREANLAKGIPGSRLGPSGRPIVHTVQHSTTKGAREAAERQVPPGGKVRFDAHPMDGQRPHYKAEDARGGNVKPVVHHCPPDRRC